MQKIIICDPNSDWANQFESIAGDIRALISTADLRIDHIGSTSVTGLSAKDIIDIQITVEDLNESSIVSNLSEAGYQYRQDIYHDNLVGLSSDSPELQKKYFREKIGGRATNIHIREEGRLNQIYPLIFRDFLRSNIAVRDAYSIIKKELAVHFSDDIDAYYSIKDPHMDTIYQAAKIWSMQSNWKPDDRYI